MKSRFWVEGLLMGGLGVFSGVCIGVMAVEIMRATGACG